MNEAQTIEWKRSWRDEYLQWICAFANTQGGTLMIGKDDKGLPTGLSNPQKLLEDIPSKIKSHLGIISKVNLFDDDDKSVIEIITQPYSNPISFKGKFYIRSGSTTHELNGAELNEFLLEKSGRNWDGIIVNNATIADIDSNAIEDFFSANHNKGRLPDSEGLSDLEIMHKLRLADGDHITRAGIILFAKDPNKFIPNCKVMIGRFGEDAEDLKFQEVIEGSLIYTLQEVQSQLNHKFLTRPVDFVGMLRQEADEYPVAALREMLLNALVHKFYSGAAVQIRVFDHKLSIWNEGLLPAGLTVDNLKVEHNSKPRNPLIADACFKAGYIDTWGRGTLKIIKACREAGLPEPQIVEKDGGIEVTIFKTVQAEPLRKDDGKDAEGLRKDYGKIAERLRKDFGENIFNTFNAIVENPSYTAEEIADRIGKSPRSVEIYLAKMKEASIIERKGPNLGGRWVIRIK